MHGAGDTQASKCAVASALYPWRTAVGIIEDLPTINLTKLKAFIRFPFVKYKASILITLTKTLWLSFEILAG